MFRINVVWAVVLTHALSVVACPAETVLCRTSDGSVQVEVSLNGHCSKQVHKSPATPSRSPRYGSGLRPCSPAGRHGACCDTLLSTRDAATCPKALPILTDHAIDFINDAGDSGLVVAGVVFVTAPLDPSRLQSDLDRLRTVRLLT